MFIISFNCHSTIQRYQIKSVLYVNFFNEKYSRNKDTEALKTPTDYEITQITKTPRNHKKKT